MLGLLDNLVWVLIAPIQAYKLISFSVQRRFNGSLFRHEAHTNRSPEDLLWSSRISILIMSLPAYYRDPTAGDLSLPQDPGPRSAATFGEEVDKHSARVDFVHLIGGAEA
ncbi:hypothetical protein PQX77_020631 [Marasmius sp. AFHP31]|nr:hypothetical protein PQX77_020631 [Marasmius sp. AFHP31]